MLACALGIVSLNCIRYERACSEMSLEHFGFSLAHSASTPIAASTTGTTVVTECSISVVPTPVSWSSSLTAPPMKRRHFSSNWGEIM